jgi:bifunctional enzyme CysN/CysC
MSRPEAAFGTIWITGLSASGKSTLGAALTASLCGLGYPAVLLDGEELRQRLGGRLGHTLADRAAMLARIVHIAEGESASGRLPIVATISHKRDMRAYAKARLGRILEVFLDCPASVCAARDRKGHYARALSGEYDCFVGVTEPYETWDDADLVLDTARQDPAESSARLLSAARDFLASAGLPNGRRRQGPAPCEAAP